MTKKGSGYTGIHVGAVPDSVNALAKSINEILEAPYVDNKTKRAALEALKAGCSVSDVTISNCSFTN